MLNHKGGPGGPGRAWGGPTRAPARLLHLRFGLGVPGVGSITRGPGGTLRLGWFGVSGASAAMGGSARASGTLGTSPWAVPVLPSVFLLPTRQPDSGQG